MMAPWLRYALWPLLLILSWIYFAVVWLRNKAYDLRWFASFDPDIPTLVLGNLSVGGSGKTPHVDFLLQHLPMDIAVLSRGYGRKTKGFLEVSINHAAIEVGDESLMLKHKHPNKSIFVGEDRVKSIQKIRALCPQIQWVICDDAFQHRRLKPTCAVVLSIRSQPFWKDRAMPLGRLREPKQGLSRADMLWLTKSDPSVSYTLSKQEENAIQLYQTTSFPVFVSQFNYAKAVLVLGMESSSGFYDSNTEDKILANSVLVAALCALAEPSFFIQEIANQHTLYESLIFPDHHAYTQEELKNLLDKLPEGMPIITTEKDYVKLLSPEFDSLWLRNPLYILPVQVSFEDSEVVIASILSLMQRSTATI